MAESADSFLIFLPGLEIAELCLKVVFVFQGFLFIVSFLVSLKDQKQDREIQKKGADPSCEKESYPFFSGGKEIFERKEHGHQDQKKNPGNI